MSKGVYVGVYQDATNTAINTVLKPEHVGTYVSLSQRNGGFTHASDGTLTSTACEDDSNVRCVINFSRLATQSGYGYDEKFTLKIDWTVSSESGYDFFSIYDNTTSEVYVEASGSKSGSITLTIYPTTIIVAQYEKDSSGKSGNDRGTLKMTLSGG
jgi:UDP-N-acetylmuramate-alanine ligase